MICKVCNTDKMIRIMKPKSQMDEKKDQEIGFLICKTCDPIMASYVLLTDGFKELCKEFNKKENI